MQFQVWDLRQGAPPKRQTSQNHHIHGQITTTLRAFYFLTMAPTSISAPADAVAAAPSPRDDSNSSNDRAAAGGDDGAKTEDDASEREVGGARLWSEAEGSTDDDEMGETGRRLEENAGEFSRTSIAPTFYFILRE